MPSTLAANRIGADDATTTLVMLHGIYGRGRNWQTIARAVVAQRPQYACWLVDMPYHGDSPAGTHGDTVTGLAEDIADWLDQHSLVPAAILGHSFGGKVALAIADRERDRALQVWVIDSTPETKPPSGSAWGMLEVIRGLPQRFSSREEATQAIVDAGYTLGVAQWMATNLTRSEGGFVWKIDVGAMQRLLDDFFTTDLWHVVERPAPRHEIHILKASESNAISPAAVERIAAARGPHVYLHHREGGHWIHAESPQVVADLLIEHLQ
jgi:pimeloyl-ACP methyl ester carboxylesterase